MTFFWRQAGAEILDDGANHVAVRPNRHLAVLILVFAVEAVVFLTHAATQIAPFYPRNFDQTSYLVDTYDLVHQIRSVGFAAIIAKYLSPNATGISFIVQGALIALVSGYNRTALYSLNLAYFIALQIVLFHTIKSRTRKAHLAWVGLTLLVSATTVFNDAGGIYDYRIDFSALCLYGIWCCVVLNTNCFQSGRGALILAAVGALLVSLRTITALYVGVIFVGLLAIGVAELCRRRARSDPLRARRQIRNTVAAAILTGLAVAPFLFAARHAIYDYYWVGHVLSQEKYIRSAENHIHGVWDHLLYYPRSIIVEHLGKLTTRLWLALFIIVAVYGMRWDRLWLSSFRTRLSGLRFELIALVLAIVVPVALLTADVSKSPVVGGITTVPIVLLATLLLFAICPETVSTATHMTDRSGSLLQPAWARYIRRRLPRVIIEIAPLVVGLICIVLFAIRGTVVSHALSPQDEEHIAQINTAIDRYVVEKNIDRPRESFDRVVDYLNNGTLILFGYETYHRRIDFNPLFGHSIYGIFATPRDVALRLLQESDVVVLTDPVLGREAPYPMNTIIRTYWSDLWAWAVENRTLIFSTTILGVPHSVFVRPTARTDGRP